MVFSATTTFKSHKNKQFPYRRFATLSFDFRLLIYHSDFILFKSILHFSLSLFDLDTSVRYIFLISQHFQVLSIRADSFESKASKMVLSIEFEKKKLSKINMSYLWLARNWTINVSFLSLIFEKYFFIYFYKFFSMEFSTWIKKLIWAFFRFSLVRFAAVIFNEFYYLGRVLFCLVDMWI